jgi:hypothetical protein
MALFSASVGATGPLENEGGLACRSAAPLGKGRARPVIEAGACPTTVHQSPVRIYKSQAIAEAGVRSCIGPGRFLPNSRNRIGEPVSNFRSARLLRIAGSVGPGEESWRLNENPENDRNVM